MNATSPSSIQAAARPHGSPCSFTGLYSCAQACRQWSVLGTRCTGTDSYEMNGKHVSDQHDMEPFAEARVAGRVRLRLGAACETFNIESTSSALTAQ